MVNVPGYTHVSNHRPTKKVEGKIQPELIIGMDHNVDLLESLTHHPTHSFMDETVEANLLPTITHPSSILLLL